MTNTIQNTFQVIYGCFMDIIRINIVPLSGFI